MKKLYIIGNGFDVHHNVPSSYLNYREWLQENHLDIIFDIDERYGYTDDEWWGEFETNLSEVSDLEGYVSEMVQENYPDYGSDDYHDADIYDAEVYIGQEFEDIIYKIKHSFNDWVASLPKPNPDKKVDIDYDDSFFVSFNYTDTLEQLYDIAEKDILYIHGKANRDQDLILGHGKTKEEIFEENKRPEPEIPDDLSEEEIAEFEEEIRKSGDFIYDRAFDEAINKVASLQKNTEGILRLYKDVFDKFHEVRKVYIYGLSFSVVDIPYLKAWIRMFDLKKVDFEVSFYQDDDEDYFKSQLIRLGVPEHSIKMIRLNDIVMV